MKLTALFLLAGFINISAAGWSQNVTLKVSKESLQTVLTDITRQTGYGFLYRSTQLQQANKVTIDVKDKELTIVLDEIFKDQPFRYQITNNTIVVTPKKTETTLATPEFSPTDNATIDMHGVVKDEAGKPAAGVAVRVKGTNKGTTTNDNGEFTLAGIDPQATLVFSSVNMETFEVKLNGRNDIALMMKAKVSQLEDVAVQVNTGYQTIPKERATGSFVFLDSSILSRKVSTNILDRLEGVASGLVFNKNIALGGVVQKNQSSLAMRGRSTINSNPNPLIVVDNFPYDGDISTINPDDVESITLLKDAAAASIWGAFSGNGVIVITTKRGKYNQTLKVSLNSWIGTSNQPNLYYGPQINSSDYIDIELFLFGKGFYNSALTSISRPSLSPVIEILAKRRSGAISSADSASQIDGLRKLDRRKDIGKYLYQNSLSQHYDVNFMGGSQRNKYFFSAGFDNNETNLVNNPYQRVTIKTGNTYSLFKQRLELSTDIQFQQSISSNNNGGSIASNYPYLSLADGAGSALIIPNFSGYRLLYTDTAGQGKMLDWNYRPLDELKNANNVTRLVDYHINLEAKYRVTTGLIISILYNYNRGISDLKNFQSQQTYFTRNLINSFAQINFTASNVTRPVPLGGILDRSNNSYESNNIRGLVNYTHTWSGDHALTLLAGAEMKKYNSFNYSYRLYGYDPENTTYSNVDYVGQYTSYVTKNNAQIPGNIQNLGTNLNSISYYGLGSYTYKKKYTVSSSIRRDESNIWGVSTNQKGVPLYSIGGAWDISQENFYHINWMPNLKIRVTEGYQGNNNTNVSALTTISYTTALSLYNAVQASVQNLPNPLLKWEKVNHINFGLDFATKNNRISGSVDYFIKNSSDLIAATPLDPTTGSSSFMGNTANMKTTGIDVILNTKNILSKQFEWSSNLLVSYAADKVTAYLLKPASIGTSVLDGSINPIVGKPLYSIFAYRWAGLDSVGNPQAILDGKVSEAYGNFGSSANFDNLRYIGSANPLFTGSLRNNFTFKQFSFSFLIIYKLGYYFRRPSINYSSLFAVSGGPGNPDYAGRWQIAGDEKITAVPSMIYPIVGSRDAVYNSSDILVEKGDHIRLQDVQMNYSLKNSVAKKIGFQSVQFYANVNNPGILWRANKKQIDPDYVATNLYTYPNPCSYSAGFKLVF